MKTPQQIFENWEATYGNSKNMIQGAMYDAGLMIEFAEFYHKEMFKHPIKFKVLDTKTNKIVKPYNFYFVLKQNGELWTVNHDLSFTKAKPKYKVVIIDSVQIDS